MLSACLLLVLSGSFFTLRLVAHMIKTDEAKGNFFWKISGQATFLICEREVVYHVSKLVIQEDEAKVVRRCLRW